MLSLFQSESFIALMIICSLYAFVYLVELARKDGYLDTYESSGQGIYDIIQWCDSESEDSNICATEER